MPVSQFPVCPLGSRDGKLYLGLFGFFECWVQKADGQTDGQTLAAPVLRAGHLWLQVLRLGAHTPCHGLALG
jgi:hypothetical protein